MKYKSLRLLSSLFAIALLFSMIPMAHASSTRASDYFAYTETLYSTISSLLYF